MALSDLHFINLDFDLRTPADPAPILAALGKRVTVIHRERLGRRHWVRLELARQPKDPAGALRRFLDLIDALPRPARAIASRGAWELDVGVQSGVRRGPAEWLFEPKLLARVARLGARIRFTVYPYVEETGEVAR